MAREIVTSENREEYLEKKMAEKSGKKVKKKPEVKKEKPHGIWHSSSDRLHSHYPSYEEGNKFYETMKSKDKFSIAELSDKEKKELGYL